MKKHKLSEKQHSKLKDAVAREQQANQSFQIAQKQAADAANHRIAIMEMIFDTIGEPMPADGVKIHVSDNGVLSYGENGTASARIKKELQRGAMKRGVQDKAKKSAKVVSLKPSK